MTLATWEELTFNLNEDDLSILTRYRQLCHSVGPSVERISRSEISFSRERVFSSGFMKSHRLEIAIDLLRPVTHKAVIAVFHTTKRVITHRLTLCSIDELDASIRDMLQDAYDTVGLGHKHHYGQYVD